MKAVNRDKIIEAQIIEPYENDPTIPIDGNTHGWQVALIVGYTNEGFPIKMIIDKESEYECKQFMYNLGFIIF